MAKRLLFIRPSGEVTALCDNILENSPSLKGQKEIKRAADVEYNNVKGVWEIILPSGEIIGSHARRDEAIKLEIKLVQQRIKDSILAGV